MEKRFNDLISGTSVFVLSLLAYFVLVPTQIKMKADTAIGPDFFPKLSIFVLGLCGMIQALIQLKALISSGEIKSQYRPNIKKYLPQLCFLLSAAGYLLAISYLGFLIPSIIFLFFLLWFFGEESFVKNLVISAIYTVIVWYVFSVFFKIRFPRGPLGF